MRSIMRLTGLLVLALFAFLAVFLYINLRTPKEPLPPLTSDYGNEPPYQQREWWNGTTVYQIYPRSFQDSDGDGIGDLGGIISRLDYLRDLGFETLWLSPFFVSPQRDFGYDVSDFRRPDPVYGDSLLVDSLIREVHRRDMKIVFDLVLNHTSEEHPWFQASRSGPDDPKSDWYVWWEGSPDQPPNNWQNALATPAWHYDDSRQAWYYAAFLPFQPDLNWRNPEVKTAMFDAARYWLDRGVDGFRLDIFNFIYEDSLFRDNPFTLRYVPTPDFVKARGQHRKYNINHPDNFTLAQEFRAVLDEYKTPARFAVGEVFGPHSVLKTFLGEQRDGLHLVFLFDITDFEWRASFFREHIRRFEAFYPLPYQPTYVFSNHDRPRSITRLENDVRKARLLALLQFTVRGVPFTYQGEEIGMHTGSIPSGEAKDPLPSAIQQSLPGFLQGSGGDLPFVFNRDNCRTPMQWTAGPNAGFTSPEADPWLPVLPTHGRINVAAQQRADTSLLQTYRALLTLRRQSMPLRWGSLQLLEEDLPKTVLAYRRIYHEQQMAVHLNFSGSEQTCPLAGSNLVFTIGDARLENGQLILGPHSGAVSGD